MIVDRPIAGWYRRRLVKGGPFVPVLIFVPCPVDPFTGEQIDRSRHLLCLVGEDWADPYEQWSWVAGNPINRAEYLFMVATTQWDKTYAPLSPQANPRLPVDLGTMEIPF